LDSFLFEFFEFFLKRFGEDSSGSGIPEAAPIRRSPIISGPFVAQNRCVQRSKLGKTIEKPNRTIRGVPALRVDRL
jgi:hypothetical protein